MAENTTNIDLIRSQIVPKARATRLYLRAVPLLNVRELAVVWPATHQKLMEDAQDYLRRYAASDNLEPRSYVTDPIADGETVSGRWRLFDVRLASRQEGGGVVAVYREGFVRTFAELQAETPFLVQARDALLNPHASLPAAEDEATEYKYRSVDATVAITLKDALKASDSAIIAAVVSRSDDGAAEINYSKLTRTWVSATNASATDDTEQRDLSDSVASPRITRTREWSQITKASVDVILTSPVAAWGAGTVYAAGAVASNASKYYWCLTAHTASSAFATDFSAGKWQLCVPVQIEGADLTDGSGRVRLALARVFSIASSADLATMPVRFSQDHAILDLFGFQTGQGANLVATIASIDPANRDECAAITDADLCSKIMLREGVEEWTAGTVGTPVVYSVGNKRTYSGTPYFCIVAYNNTGTTTFAQDVAAGKWREYGAAYAESTAYKADEVVLSGGFFYRFPANKTSTTSAADILDGSMVRHWQYADRRFAIAEDGTGVFAVHFRLVTFRSWVAGAAGTALTATTIVNSYPEGVNITMTSGATETPVIVRVKTFKLINSEQWAQARADLWLYTDGAAGRPDEGFLIDDVRLIDNRDGSVDLVQQLSKVDTTCYQQWDEAGSTYFIYVYYKGIVTSATRMDSVWTLKKMYFTSENAALLAVGYVTPVSPGTPSRYGHTLQQITPNAFAAVLKTKGTDKASVW